MTTLKAIIGILIFGSIGYANASQWSVKRTTDDTENPTLGVYVQYDEEVTVVRRRLVIVVSRDGTKGVAFKCGSGVFVAEPGSQSHCGNDGEVIGATPLSAEDAERVDSAFENVNSPVAIASTPDSAPTGAANGERQIRERHPVRVSPEEPRNRRRNRNERTSSSSDDHSGRSDDTGKDVDSDQGSSDLCANSNRCVDAELGDIHLNGNDNHNVNQWIDNFNLFEESGKIKIGGLVPSSCKNKLSIAQQSSEVVDHTKNVYLRIQAKEHSSCHKAMENNQCENESSSCIFLGDATDFKGISTKTGDDVHEIKVGITWATPKKIESDTGFEKALFDHEGFETEAGANAKAKALAQKQKRISLAQKQKRIYEELFTACKQNNYKEMKDVANKFEQFMDVDINKIIDELTITQIEALIDDLKSAKSDELTGLVDELLSILDELKGTEKEKFTREVFEAINVAIDRALKAGKIAIAYELINQLKEVADGSDSVIAVKRLKVHFYEAILDAKSGSVQFGAKFEYLRNELAIAMKEFCGEGGSEKNCKEVQSFKIALETQVRNVYNQTRASAYSQMGGMVPSFLSPNLPGMSRAGIGATGSYSQMFGNMNSMAIMGPWGPMTMMNSPYMFGYNPYMLQNSMMPVASTQQSIMPSFGAPTVGAPSGESAGGFNAFTSPASPSGVSGALNYGVPSIAW